MEHTDNSDTKKENFTFRIDPKIMQIIKNRSKTENVSINQYTNNLLRTAVEWNIHARAAGWIPMPKQILVELADRLTEDEIPEIAKKKAKEIAQDIILFMEGKYDIDSWLNFMRIRASAAGFQYSEQIEKNKIKCIMHHGLGKKWSLWFTEFYKSVFSDLNKQTVFDVGENTISMTITK